MKTKLILATAALPYLAQRALAFGCLGGVKGVTYFNDDDKCNCASVACTKETCEGDMGGVWTDDCPACDPEKCDPLAPSDEDPPCTGPPEAIDRFGKKMYRRKLIHREIPDLPDEAGVFCHIILELCPGESQLTHGMDTGFGDFYRIGATAELQDLKAKPDNSSYTYSGMHKPTGARSYSPVTPLNENTVQLTLKEVVGRGSDYDCTNGVDCEYGMTELACMAPIGSDFLLSKRPDQQGKQGTHMAYVPNFSREPGSGPYTVNVIGQGVALTELNILVLSELLNPFAEDGSFSAIQEVNYLWANSYWSSTEWMWEPTNSTDLSRQMIREMGKYGIRFNLMHSISREQRPEAGFPRTNVTVIGEAFNLTNTTDQDPNVKWFVVGSGSYKKSIYPQIVEWGFDMAPCPGAESKGYPYCGTAALYGQSKPGSDPNDRERSDIFKYYEEQAGLDEEEDHASHDHSDQDHGQDRRQNPTEGTEESEDHGSHDHGSHDHAPETNPTEGTEESEDHGSHDHGSHDHGSHDHAPEPNPTDGTEESEDHGSHDHGSHDHASEPNPTAGTDESEDHGSHDHDSHDHESHDHTPEPNPTEGTEESEDNGSHDHGSHDHAPEPNPTAASEESEDHGSHDHGSHDHGSHGSHERVRTYLRVAKK